jgi:hypothetical protein
MANIFTDKPYQTNQSFAVPGQEGSYTPPPIQQGSGSIPYDQMAVPATPIVPATPPVDNTNYAGINASVTPPPVNETDAILDKYTNDSAANTPVDTTGIYTNLYGQSGLGADKNTEADLTAQLNAIAAENQVADLKLKSEGISSSAMQGRSISNEKDAAIRSLPIAARLAAVQGKIALATQHLDTLFRLQVDDAQRKYEYNQKLIDSVYDRGTKKEQQALEEKRFQAEQEFTLKRDEAARQQEIYMESIKPRGNSGLTDYQQTQTFLNISNKFQADSIMNQALKGQTAVSIADQVISNPNSATNQLKSLYILVKNLDPDSAVREGELALANQTQSYLQRFQSSLARINEGQVIAPKAAKDLALATKELASAWNQTADRRRQQYVSQANIAGIGQQFESYIGGYGNITPINEQFNPDEWEYVPDSSQQKSYPQNTFNTKASWLK